MCFKKFCFNINVAILIEEVSMKLKKREILACDGFKKKKRRKRTRIAYYRIYNICEVYKHYYYERHTGICYDLIKNLGVYVCYTLLR